MLYDGEVRREDQYQALLGIRLFLLDHPVLLDNLVKSKQITDERAAALLMEMKGKDAYRKEP